MFLPTFRYHPTEAPAGRKFTDEAEFNALSEEWVDTPAKFPAVAESSADAETPSADDAPKRRGRKPKTEAVQ